MAAGLAPLPSNSPPRRKFKAQSLRFKVAALTFNMISNPAIAKHVKELMMDVFVRVDQSITMVRQTCAKEEADAYSRAAGRIATALVMDVLGPLYERNPDLKPTDWDS
jgi:hypothetical protein